ncbi:hypothetical protein EV715DRAFT_263122 [Schizophyllum commune]
MNLKRWCTWLGGLGLAQSRDPFPDVEQEAALQKQVLKELRSRIEYHVESLAEHLTSMPQDLSEAQWSARLFAWTRKRVKMFESFLVISGAIVATFPQFGVGGAANMYTGAGMAALGGVKVVYQHFADNPDGGAIAYQSGQTVTQQMRHNGARMIIAWIELYGIIDALISSVKNNKTPSDALQEQIRDFFVAFYKHFQPSKDDINKVYRNAGQDVRNQYPDIDRQFNFGVMLHDFSIC